MDPVTLPFIRGKHDLSRAATTPLPPPEEFELLAGRYEVEGVLGQGGMGTVLKVRHRRLRKPFALKLMRSDFSRDFEWRRLFYREAQLASSLVHPNIVSVVDFGEDAKRGLFMVMELLSGELISERIKRMGRLPVKAACDVAMQLAEALHHSHSQEVVHADIKPDNVLCVRLPSSERRKWSIKLLDFGMAHLASPDDTTQESIGGTPEYMAPEKITGAPPHPSMDLYSLGILLYEMLTGHVPFSGGTPTEILHRHLAEEIPLVSSQRDSLDESIDAMVARALEKDPANRQRDMAAFIYELRTVMEMLGLRGRRRALDKPIRAVDSRGQNSRDQEAASAFDALPVPAAKLSFDGTVLVGNRAFARFVGSKKHRAQGLNIFETSLPVVHPGLKSELEQVAKTRASISSDFSFVSRDKNVRMTLLIKGPESDTDSCVVVFYTK